jgi:hypothetical protein
LGGKRGALALLYVGSVARLPLHTPRASGFADTERRQARAVVDARERFDPERDLPLTEPQVWAVFHSLWGDSKIARPYTREHKRKWARLQQGLEVVFRRARPVGGSLART